MDTPIDLRSKVMLAFYYNPSHVISKKGPHGPVVSTLNFGSGVSGSNSTGGKFLPKPDWRFIAQSLICFLPLSWYDSNTVEKDIKPQTIHTLYLMCPLFKGTFLQKESWPNQRKGECIDIPHGMTSEKTKRCQLMCTRRLFPNFFRYLPTELYKMQA